MVETNEGQVVICNSPHLTLPDEDICSYFSLSWDLAEGRGSLIDNHTVEVTLTAGGARKITAKTILVATGGKPTKIDIPGSVSPTLHLPASPKAAFGFMAQNMLTVLDCRLLPCITQLPGSEL